MIFGAETNAYKRGMEEVERRGRVRALGAIRRAVEIARNADVTWEEWDTYIDPDVSIPAFQEGVRRAIRAAIGSEKA